MGGICGYKGRNVSSTTGVLLGTLRGCPASLLGVGLIMEHPWLYLRLSVFGLWLGSGFAVFFPPGVLQLPPAVSPMGNILRSGGGGLDLARAGVGGLWLGWGASCPLYLCRQSSARRYSAFLCWFFLGLGTRLSLGHGVFGSMYCGDCWVLWWLKSGPA